MYATANWAMCKNALTSCWNGLGVKVCGCRSGVVDWVEGVLLGSSEASVRREAAVGCEGMVFWCERTMYASYSREARRRASRDYDQKQDADAGSSEHAAASNVPAA